MLRRSSHRLRHPRPRRRASLAVGYLVALSAVFLLLPTMGDVRAFGGPLPTLVGPGGIGPMVVPVLSVSKSIGWTMSPSFWGADVRVYYALGTTQTSTINATPIQFVRWPGGAVADEYNYTSNQIYSNSGSSYAPPSNESQFIGWCRGVGCHAILQLPAEIDTPSTAAYYVHYTISVLRFHPAYWEIGNEPAQWNHFGSPWSSWTASQNVNATPGTYARTVHAYVRAIRAVDPTASIIGLAGVGTGGYNEATWIQATVRMNGPNLSAVAIHVYPAGGSATTNGTATGYFGALSGNGAIPFRVPRDRAAILSACPTCTQLELFVTELGSGTSGGPYQSFMNGFSAVPFTAAEVAQAIVNRVANVELYALQSTYGGSLLNASGAPAPTDILFSRMLTHLEPIVLNFSLSAAPGQFYVVPGRNSNANAFSLLVVNANATVRVRLGLAATGFPLLHPGAYWNWDGTTSGPRWGTWALGGGPTSVVLAPQSVLVLQFS